MNQFNLTHEQLSGQRLMVGFYGTALNSFLKFVIGTLKVGGIILFKCNVEMPDQIKALCNDVQEYARKCGQPPLIIAIDQEGGAVARLQKPFTQFDGNPAMRNESDAETFARITANELINVGINMNMAPVMDVAPKEMGSIMASRSFGHDPDWVSKLGVKIIDTLQRKKIMAVAKHFPGIGRTTQDSHCNRTDFNEDYATLASSDLPPFTAAITHNVAGIMLSHIIYSKIDKSWPASLSPLITKNLLRDQMGYTGVVMTDDFDMAAIEKYYDMPTVIGQMLTSDIDMALICHQGPNIETAFGEILSRIRNNRELRRRGEMSVSRILAMKRKYLDHLL